MEADRAGWRGDAAALGWLVVLAAALLGPALAHGGALGPYDLLREIGLTATASPHIHNTIGSDEIEEFIPWQALDWLQVHAGHLPLWNPDSLLGMPLAFNMESAPFSLAVAVGYLFPLHLAHSATVVATLLIGATGAYVAARSLGLAVLPALVAASIFELSGAFTVWLGAYESACLGFAGWVIAASVLVLRGRRRPLAIAALAVVVALAVAAGEPQIAAVLLVSLGIYVVIVIAGVARRGERARARRAALDHLIALVAAGALVAPVYLPALQLGIASAREQGPFVSGLPLYDLSHLALAAYNGVPTNLTSLIGPDNLYVSMIYVGVIGLCLALCSLALVRRRTEVLALGVVAAVLLVALFFSPVVDLLRAIPLLRVFRLDLATPMLDFSLAMLAGFGAAGLLSSDGSVRRRADRLLELGVLAAFLALSVLGVRLALNVDRLDATQESVRAGSFVFPAVSLVALGVFVAFRRHSRAGSRPVEGRAGGRAIVGLLVLESALLALAGENVPSSAAKVPPPSEAIARLARISHGALVGIGSCVENAFPNLGILPNVNLLYGVKELIVYDPIVPSTYYASYGEATGGSTAPLVPHLFCPAIRSLRLARLYGVSDVLEPPGARPPAGMVRVATLHGEGLFRVPGSGRATLTSASGKVRVVQASEPTPDTWTVKFSAKTRSRLELRITDEPGWQATIDGRPLALSHRHAVMLAASVPPGHHVVRLRYWPRAFSVGLAISALAVLVLAFGVAFPLFGRLVLLKRARSARRAGAGRRRN
ncbi:MAG: YfhO family protein [Actinomycetota bacterium]|nr:YfhO family protein [Actinomycetota bacterium]